MCVKQFVVLEVFRLLSLKHVSGIKLHGFKLSTLVKARNEILITESRNTLQDGFYAFHKIIMEYNLNILN